MPKNFSIADEPSTSSDLKGQNALITGASSGLGRHMAETLARAGANVAVCARRMERLSELVSKIAEGGGRAIPIELDVTDHASVSNAISTAESALGRLSILINNAGVARAGLIVDQTPDDYSYIMDTNVKGSWLVARAVGAHMIRHGSGGKIVNISSIAATQVGKQLSLYSMSKAALEIMTRAMAKEWLRYNIQVNAIAPGFIMTDMNRDFFLSERGQKAIAEFPTGRIGVPSDLDGVLLLLVSGDSRSITGSIMVADDGQTL